MMPLPNPKMSQLASIRNGEIPVVIVYLNDNVPLNYKMVAPQEAIELLAFVEYLRDQFAQTQGKEKTAAKGKKADDQE
ncbi:MAG: hypothetical protein RBS68_06015 [Anaerolineales bacterium]|jgi:hypothetical protein|nr:hypothetical protein [Anaerolineales bacterium]